jgi:hypothetical protein
MTKLVRPLAIVIDTDFGVLSEAVRITADARHQVIGRLSPRGMMEVIAALQPELVLLGMPFWEQGWGPLFRSASPDTVVFPIGADPDAPGVLRLGRLAALLRGTLAAEGSHAA